MHSDIFDSVVRHLSMFDLCGLKSTFLMFLQFCVSDISFYVFRRQLSTFLRLIVRSRTVFNTYTIDRLLKIDDIDENDIADVESEQTDLSEIDDDEEYKASIIASEVSNIALVQQLSTAGVRIHNQVYSLVNISMFFNYSYIQFYATLHVFCYLFIMSLLFNLVYFIHYV